MAVNRTHIPAPPEAVFDVLADGWSYADWVVGAKKVRDVDAGWPAPGTRIHHTVGVGPLTLDDNTEVYEVKRPEHLVLDARGRPFGKARVEIQLSAEGGGTLVTMIENLVQRSTLLDRLFDLLIHVRNTEALRRLGRVVEGRTSQEARERRSPTA